MEKKILYIVVGLIVGIVLGLPAGYFAAPTQNLQGQISNLQAQLTQKNSQIQQLQEQVNSLTQEVTRLRALLGPIRTGAWNLIKTFQGASGFITDYFYVAGADLRINWTWRSSAEQFAGFSIYIYKEGQTVFTGAFLSLQDKGTTFVHNLTPANYYLKISEANLDQWIITVEVWIPT